MNPFVNIYDSILPVDCESVGTGVRICGLLITFANEVSFLHQIYSCIARVDDYKKIKCATRAHTRCWPLLAFWGQCGFQERGLQGACCIDLRVGIASIGDELHVLIFHADM